MTRHTVLIPLVQRNSTTGDLLEIYCEARLPSAEQKVEREIGMNPVTEALRAINLQKQGREAFAATEKLLPAHAKQQFNLEARKISHSNFPDHANIDEGDSAGLGIALVLLMNAGNCTSNSVVIASGAIKVNPGDERFDVDIVKVNYLDQKFTAALAKSALTDSVFFVPQANVDNDGALLESEPAKGLNDKGIRIIPVATLREAADYLGIVIPESSPDEEDKSILQYAAVIKTKNRFRIYGAVAAALFLLCLIAWFVVSRPSAQQSHASIRFLADSAPYVESPFIVCNPNSRFPNYKKLTVSGLAPQASVKDILGWRIQIDAANKSNAAKASYFLLSAFVGEQSGLRLLLVNKKGDFQISLPVGKHWSREHQLDGLDGKAEAGVLVFLANAAPFDTDALSEQFNAKFASAPYKVDLAQAFLKQQADISLIYFFDMTEQPSVCKASHVLPAR